MKMSNKENKKNANLLLSLFDFPEVKKGFGESKESVLTLPDLSLDIGLKQAKIDGAREIDLFTFKEKIVTFKNRIKRDSDYVSEKHAGTQKNPEVLDNLQNILPRVAIVYCTMAYYESMLGSARLIADKRSSKYVENCANLFQKNEPLDYENNLMLLIQYRAILIGLKNNKIITHERMPDLYEAQHILSELKTSCLNAYENLEADSN